MLYVLRRKLQHVSASRTWQQARGSLIQLKGCFFFRDDIHFPPGLHLRNCSVNLHAYIYVIIYIYTYIWYMFFIDISSWLSLLACFTSKIFISAVNSSTPPGLVLRKSTWSLAHRVPNVYSCRMLPWKMRKPARGNGTRFFFMSWEMTSRISNYMSDMPNFYPEIDRSQSTSSW